MHPRTAVAMARERPRGISPRVRIVEPLGYLQFLNLVESAAGVLTDSGGIQEECTYLDVPCFTLRDNTERPVTCDLGTNVLLGLAPERIVEVPERLASGRRRRTIPAGWDGSAGERVVDVLERGVPEQPGFGPDRAGAGREPPRRWTRSPI
jgi:UDP-N-acetylglucosamine 2-epimerase (non-hydrolysing)